MVALQLGLCSTLMFMKIGGEDEAGWGAFPVQAKEPAATGKMGGKTRTRLSL
jgi:hypothetical protein